MVYVVIVLMWSAPVIVLWQQAAQVYFNLLLKMMRVAAAGVLGERNGVQFIKLYQHK